MPLQQLLTPLKTNGVLVDVKAALNPKSIASAIFYWSP
jgi:hypothetical protein